MMHRVLSYLQYLIISRSKYRIHSPFIYKFDTQVINDRRVYYGFKNIESLRAEMLRSRKKITFRSFGTRGTEEKTMFIGSLVRKTAVTRKFGRFLFRTVNYFQPQHILEVGTGTGISTMYLAFPKTTARMISLEGSSELAGLAAQNLEKLTLDHVDIRSGAFENTLPEALHDLGHVDLVFIDGDHREEATLWAFRQLLRVMHNDSLVIIHDIHWSPGMSRAWKQILALPEANVTIDLFQAGIVFLRRQQARQHFIVWF